jgi:hypothetical protein
MNTLKSHATNEESTAIEDEFRRHAPDPLTDDTVRENAVRLAINIHLCQD